MTNQEKNTDKKILAFHIGRGGRFNNGGYKTFLGEMTITQTHAFSDLFPPILKDDDGQRIEDKEGSSIDDLTPNAEYTNDSGNSVSLTNAEVESGIGTIDQDGEYDTTYTTFDDDLSDSEIEAIRRSIYASEYSYLTEEA